MNIKPTPIPRSVAHEQRGASLFIVLVLLLTIGLMTLTGFYMARNQYSLVGNLQFQEQAFNQAEAAVAAAENWLETGNNARSADFTTYNQGSGVFPKGQLAALALDPKTMTWTDTNSVAVTDGRYLVSKIAGDQPFSGSSLQQSPLAATCKVVNIFQVIGRSNAPRGAARTIETTYATLGC